MKKLLFVVTALGLLAGGEALRRDLKPAPAYQGQPIHLWIEDLASSDYNTRDQAIEAIRVIGPEAVSDLVRALHRQETPFAKIAPGLSKWFPFMHLGLQPNAAIIRERAAEQLGEMGRNSEAVLPALISALAEEEPHVRSEVQRALRRIGPESIVPLIHALNRRSARIRAGAAEILVDFAKERNASGAGVPLAASGSEAPAGLGAAIPALVLVLKDPDEMVRSYAAQGLGWAAQPPSNVVAGLTTALEDKSPAVRRAAAESLGKFGPQASGVLGPLGKRFADVDATVRVCAARSSWQIGGAAPLVVAVLIEALKDRTAGWQAVFVLAEIGPAAERAVPALIEVLKQERVSRPLRSPPSSSFALGRIGPAAIPSLIEILDDERAAVRTGAAIALGFIGPNAKRVVPNLIPMLKDKDLEVRQATALSLATIQPQTAELPAVLMELSKDQDIFISGAAIAALRASHPALAHTMGLR